MGNLLSIERLTPPGSGIGIFLVNPFTGPVTQICRLQGYGFDPVASNNVVKFNGVTATVSSATAYTLTVVVPAGATTGTVTVTNANSCSSTGTFTVTTKSCIVDFSGQILFSNNTNLGVKDALVSVTGSATGSNLTDINGNFSIVTTVTTGNFTLKPTKTVNKLNGLTVADATAISLCQDNALPILVFNLLVEGNIARAVRGERIGTLVAS